MSSISITHKRCFYLAAVGLTAFCMLSTYILFFDDFPVMSHYHSDAPITTNTHTNHRSFHRLGRILRHQKFHHSLSTANESASTTTLAIPTSTAETQHRLRLQLTPKQELAALTSFLAAHEQHALPAETELDVPLDPDLILGFDFSSPHALEEMVQVQLDVWQYNPIIFGNSLQPATKRLCEALAEMDLRVGATVIALDTREDGSVIENALRRLVPESSAELPVLFLNGQLVQMDVREEGKDALQAALDAAGALKKVEPSRWNKELRRLETRW